MNRFVKELMDCLQDVKYLGIWDEDKIYTYGVLLKKYLMGNEYSELIKDMEYNDYKIQFDCRQNALVIEFDDLSYFYTIIFDTEIVSRNYCNCSPIDEGYNEEYDCCGYDCDWIRPSMEIQVSRTLGNHKYDGVAHDLWDDMKDLKTLYEGKVDEEIQSLENQIKELQKRIQELKEI